MSLSFNRTASIFALAAGLTACASVPRERDFSELTFGEQADFTTCVLSATGSTVNLTSGRNNSAGSVLDSVLAAPGKVADTARTAAYACARGAHIRVNSIPGFR